MCVRVLATRLSLIPYSKDAAFQLNTYAHVYVSILLHEGEVSITLMLRPTERSNVRVFLLMISTFSTFVDFVQLRNS
jgi:hypothetical protein